MSEPELKPAKPRKFKAGDRVRCVDDAGIIMLGNGEEYDVIETYTDEDYGIDYISVDFGVAEELNQSRLRASRFELVVPEYDPLVGEE